MALAEDMLIVVLWRVQISPMLLILGREGNFNSNSQTCSFRSFAEVAVWTGAGLEKLGPRWVLMEEPTKNIAERLLWDGGDRFTTSVDPVKQFLGFCSQCIATCWQLRSQWLLLRLL